MVGKDTWYNFNFLKFTKAWFVTQVMIYPGECSMSTWEESVFCCCWMEYSIHICSVCLVYSVVQIHCFLIDSLSRWSIHDWEWGIKVPYYYSTAVSHFSSVTICFICFSALMWVGKYLHLLYLLDELMPSWLCNNLPCLLLTFLA